MFIDQHGTAWNYQPKLNHLKAKKTLFISLADYTDRAFERAFERAYIIGHQQNLLVVCLSGYFHAPNEAYLGKVFDEFFYKTGSWQQNTVGSFCEMLKVTPTYINCYH